MCKKEDIMRQAITLAIENVRNNGGPFGAVITRNGQIIATGVNRVTADCTRRSQCHQRGLQETGHLQSVRL